MTTIDQSRLHTHRAASSFGAPAASRTLWWLWLSVPIALLGITTSVTGILVDRVYQNETSNWQAQAMGQDVANLVVFSVMLILGYAAARGSARAVLAWAGTVVYTSYTFAIYAFAVHFGPLFLVYVAVLGLAAWALIGCFASLDPSSVRAAYPPGHTTRFVSTFLIVLAAGFALLWVSQDLPAMIDGTPPKELHDTGLFTNPVHVLDLALFLPATMLAGVLLRRGRAWGYALAPVMLTAMAGISLGIVTLTVVNVARDHQDASLIVAAVISLLGIIQAITSWQFLRAMTRTTSIGDLLHP